jgi:hypothetical protein
MALLAGIALACGCRFAPGNEEAIRAGITQHLASMKTLKLSAMDVNIKNISIQGTQARVQVAFRPKGAPGDAGMQVAYQMEKRDSGWVVVKTDADGANAEHPGASANPDTQTGQGGGHGSVPNFRELIPTVPSTPGATLPVGHLPVEEGAKAKATDPNAKPN